MNKQLLFTTILCSFSFLLLSAAPPKDNGRGNKAELVENTETAEEKRSWVDRVFGRDRDAAEKEAEQRRREAEQRAREAREREEAEKPNWVDRLFGADKEDKDADNTANEARNKAKDASKGFSEEEREILEDWQRGQAGWKKSGKRLPPGLQKKVARGGELPPGWQKKLAVGERLPKEYESETASLPEEILNRLPKTREGTEILQIGDQVIRVMENTREIVDILGMGSNGRAD